MPAAALLVLLAATSAVAENPHHFDGSSTAWVSFPSRPAYDASVAMTVEAWVYREDATRCETVLSHDYTASYWLGFCPGLRFYRSGRSYADAGVQIRARRWTHVAASYDGDTVRFYVDGEPVRSVPLRNQGGGVDRPLVLGADPSGLRLNFWGTLAEVRLWSIVRGDADVRAGRGTRVRSAPGLVAVFPDGGPMEALSGAPGFAGHGVGPSPIRIPVEAGPPVVARR